MRIITRAILDMTTMEWVSFLEESYDYDGAVDLCKETDGQDQAANKLRDMTSQLQTTFGKVFAGQQAILDNIDGSIKNIISAGPSQYGFSAQQDAALRTQASEGTAGAYKAARQATGEQLAAIGGGNRFLPSGTKAVLQAGVNNAAAQEESRQQLGITAAGWQQGNQNWLNAVKAADTSASLLNPLGYSGQSLEAAQGSFKAQTDIANEPTTAGVVGGILGSVAGAAVGGLTGAGGFLAPKK